MRCLLPVLLIILHGFTLAQEGLVRSSPRPAMPAPPLTPVAEVPPLPLPRVWAQTIHAHDPGHIPKPRPYPQAQEGVQANLSSQCVDQLAELNIIYISAASPPNSQGCALRDGIEVSSFNGVTLTPAGKMTCRVAVSTALWLQNAVGPEAKRRLNKNLSSINHVSTYSCRRRPSGKLSEHAFGNAIDIAQFNFSDGSSVSIEPDWHRGGRKGRYLRAITQAACQYFSTVLSPLSDANHQDHLHLDKGAWRSCDS